MLIIYFNKFYFILNYVLAVKDITFFFVIGYGTMFALVDGLEGGRWQN